MNEQRAEEGKGILLSLVVPVLNEAESIQLFLDRTTPVIAKVNLQMGQGASTEIVFVDDGSTDATADVIRNATCPGCHIRLVSLSRNFGKDSALAAGLLHAQGDAAVPMDVDLQDPPELLIEMVAAWQQGARVVNAVRVDRSSDSWSKRRSASLFYRLFNRISHYDMPENVGDFRLLDRKVIDLLNTLEERVRFNKGLVAWCGFRSVDVHYVRPSREAGQSKWKLWSLWNFALDGITGTSTLPLRVWSYFGFVVALLALLYTLFIVLRTLIFGVDLPGYASLLSVTLTLGAVILIALGVLGEYVGRIAIEVRRRPLFIIDEVSEIGSEAPPLSIENHHRDKA